MSKKLCYYSLQVLMILFITSLSIQKLDISSSVFSALDLLTLFSSLAMLGIAIEIKKENFSFYFEWYDIFYFLFLLAVMISRWVNPGMGIGYYLRAFLLNYLTLILTVRNIPEYLTPKLFLSSFLIAYFPLVASHLIYKPTFFSSTPYSGLFSNPNGFGVFMTSITIVLFAIVFIELLEKKVFRILFYTLLAFFSLYLTILSASRTAFMAIFLSLFVALLVYMNDLLHKINQKQRKIFLLLIISSLILLYFLIKDSSIASVFQKNIIDKFVRKIQEGSGLLSGREPIWKYYLENSYLFKSEIQSLRSIIGFSPHNAFIEVISRFGRVAGFFYIGFWFISMKNVLKYLVKASKTDKYLPFYLMALISFIGTGMMEIVTYHPLMYLAVYAGSMVLVETKKESEKAYTFLEIKDKILS